MEKFVNGSWVYSVSSEVFNITESYSTREEAIAAGREDLTYNGKHAPFYIGQVQNKEVGLSIDPDLVLDCVHSTVYDEIGEAAEDYLNDVTKEHWVELEEVLSKALQDWAKKNEYEPNFFLVVNREKIEEENE